MTTFQFSRCIVCLSGLLGSTAILASAQAPTSRGPGPDSIAAATSEPPKNAWLTLGVGGGSVGFAASAGLHGSSGPLLGGVFANDNAFIDDGISSQGVVVGMRTSRAHLFATGAIGVARAQRSSGSLDYGAQPDAAQAAMVLESSAHLTNNVVGFSVTVTGLFGPARVRSGAVTLGLDLGSFRRPPPAR